MVKKQIVFSGILAAAIIILIILYFQSEVKPEEKKLTSSNIEVSTASSVQTQDQESSTAESDSEKLYVELLLLEDRSFKNIKKLYGTDYTIKSHNYFDLYQYDNGMAIDIDPYTGESARIYVNDKEIYPDARILHGNVLPEGGIESIVLNYGNLIVLNEKSKKILKEISTDYSGINQFEVGPFLNDDVDELYLQEYEGRRGIFKIIEGELREIYREDDFGFYLNRIKATITSNQLNFKFDIEGNTTDTSSFLPDRVFYNNKDKQDKNSLISIDNSWEIVQQKGKWLVRERYLVNFAMLTYYWGPPEIGVEDNETMYNDLARVDVYYEIKDGKPQFFKLDYKVKYSGEYQEDCPPIMDEEGRIVNGPALGMSLEEAVKSLGGDESIKSEEEYEYEKDGVYVCNIWGGTTDIEVKNPKYQTTRGLKVGDTIDEVERLYGSPDLGMSGDDYVEYKFCYLDEEGNLKADYYRILMIRYEKGRVSSYEFYQVILD